MFKKNCLLMFAFLSSVLFIQAGAQLAKGTKQKVTSSKKKQKPTNVVVASAQNPKPSDVVSDFDFKNIENKFGITISPDIKKYYSETDRVDGWFDKRHIVVLLLIDMFQTKNSIVGNLGEVGVWQGKSFIPLMHFAKNDEHALAIDCFELYEFNHDNSGGGLCSFEIFNKNITTYCSEPARLKVIKGDSSSFSAADYLSAMGNGKGFRIFSIDGCHEGPSTIKDMENAYNCLVDGGVIVTDDYFHYCWPGVSEGVNFFMNKNVNCLKPFLIAWNKVYFAHPDYAKKYFDILKQFFTPQDVVTKKFFGVDTLIYDR